LIQYELYKYKLLKLCLARLDFGKITLPQQQVKPFIQNIPRGMCGSRKYQYPPHGWSLEILRGVGVSKAKICKGKYEVKLEIPEGWGG